MPLVYIMSDCPERDALLGIVLNYKTELAKQPAPQKLMSYFHIPVDDARTTATTNLRGGYSSLTSSRDLSNHLTYNINTTLGSSSYQSIPSSTRGTVTYGPSGSVNYMPPTPSSGQYLSSPSGQYLH